LDTGGDTLGWLPIVAVFVNPFIAMFWFVNLVNIFKKLLKQEDVYTDLVWGCITLGWLVFSTSAVAGSN